ncbi:HhH-GPD base excision DNA repair familyprotein,Probable 3-methyladenine DNAglycosylase/8-oxoguanine DNA glycosylase [Candidatus Paraburkholderia kirkii UZHbot1]|uniref:DNA-3-methyladenine glycosylase II n=1 Tax=Candidatus Paraburkholderia kirkii UZHbot1 TaxID=1055526 RepID=G4MFR5_9BURK|nr:HhH-GPD base excision DNA repair familyprotein,Probable 3-methyladenine DNAglycosylase/8-oxoguanine DNA glycosylase [Candidatus Paraburkholderia kirkii UZHbot1]
MATARKAPVKRPVSVSDASGATKRTRGAQMKTKTNSQKIDGVASGRKTAVKHAGVGGKPAKSAALKAAKPETAGRLNGASRASKSGTEEAGASPVKGDGHAVSADTPNAQALVPDAHAGEVVRKSRVVKSDAAVPVQIGGLTREIVRPDYWDRACADLMKRDRILKKLIPKFSEIHLVNLGDPFSTLARSVAGQQISTKAAQAIWERVKGACPEIHPAQFIRLGHEKLQACGLSRRKAEYILDLAQHFENGALHVDAWTSRDDEAVIAELTQIRGIGRWTAEMFLIFNLSRPDVLPLDDLGLIQAISVNYFSGEPVTRSEAREVAANWEPWRTVATWYMWRSLNPIPADH